MPALFLVRDTFCKTYPAHIKERAPGKLYISYDGWPSKWDEWLAEDSDRLVYNESERETNEPWRLVYRLSRVGNLHSAPLGNWTMPPIAVTVARVKGSNRIVGCCASPAAAVEGMQTFILDTRSHGVLYRRITDRVYTTDHVFSVRSLYRVRYVPSFHKQETLDIDELEIFAL